MTVTLVFFVAVMAAIAGWWLLRQGMATRPWLETGAAAEMRGDRQATLPAAKVGLGVFLAVAAMLLALLRQRLHDAHGDGGLAAAARSRGCYG